MDLKISKDNRQLGFVLLLIFLFNATAFSQVLAPQTELRIDPSNVGSVMASQAFDEVNYIPLETINESVFGTIKQLFVTNEYFIIHDTDTKCILFFLKNGKFQSKISLNTNYVWNISVDYEKKELKFTKDGLWWFYNFQGKLLRSQPEKIIATSTYIFSDDKVAYTRYNVDKNANKDTIDHELFVTSHDKLYKEYLPYNKKAASIQNGDLLYIQHSRFYDTGCDTTVNFCQFYSYDIYNLSPTRLIKTFSFIFPSSNTLPKDFYVDTAFNNKRIEYIQKHPNLIYSISFPYQVGNNLFFKANRWNAPTDSYLVNLESNNLLAIKYIKPDELTCFLPITDLNDGEEFMNKNFYTSDGKYVYTSLSSALLFKYYTNAVKRDIKYNDVLKTYFTTRNRMDNPVIVQVKPKKNF